MIYAFGCNNYEGYNFEQIYKQENKGIVTKPQLKARSCFGARANFDHCPLLSRHLPPR